MTLDQACNIMEQYAQQLNRDMDDLSAIEHMVNNYKILPVEQRLAVTVFMDQARTHGD
jgi:DNA integrity scanning protein DisA with diadenylate cyclase activity